MKDLWRATEYGDTKNYGNPFLRGLERIGRTRRIKRLQFFNGQSSHQILKESVSDVRSTNKKQRAVPEGMALFAG